MITRNILVVHFVGNQHLVARIKRKLRLNRRAVRLRCRIEVVAFGYDVLDLLIVQIAIYHLKKIHKVDASPFGVPDSALIPGKACVWTRFIGLIKKIDRFSNGRQITNGTYL